MTAHPPGNPVSNRWWGTHVDTWTHSDGTVMLRLWTGEAKRGRGAERVPASYPLAVVLEELRHDPAAWPLVVNAVTEVAS